MLCAVCTMHTETRSADFLVEPQNQGLRFVSGLALKPLEWFLPVWPQNRWYDFFQFDLKTDGDGFLSLASKPRVTVFWFRPQNWQLRFGDFDIKITVSISWFGPENLAGYGLWVAPQNQQKGVGDGHASRSSDLLPVEVSWARVSPFASKQAEA
jgi:hypothetical protein